MEDTSNPASVQDANQIHSPDDDDSDDSEMEFHDALSEVDTDMEETDEVSTWEMHSCAPNTAEEEAVGRSDDGLQASIVSVLGLTKYFPGKISLQEVMLHSSGKLESLCDIPWYVLSKILMLDYRARDDIISDSMNTPAPIPVLNQNPNEICVDDFDKMFPQFENDHLSKSDQMPHPLDVFLVTFLSSSNFLRQILCEKMFLCKLSIPLVIPPVCNHESMFFLWSLRSIALECKLPNGEHCEISAVKKHIPVVSWMRLGKISRSKSKFLNEILNGQSHPTFFHRDCPNGMNKRILSEGLLEIAWYFPSDQNKNSDSLKVDVAFVNLRGDGMLEMMNKFRRFLFSISSVLFVMVDISKLDEPDIFSNLEEIVFNSSQMLVMLTNAENSQLSMKNKECIKKCIELLSAKGFGKDNLIFDFEANGERNIKDLRKETEAKIKTCFQQCPKKTTIESYQGLANNLDITVDENLQECRRGKMMALEIMVKVCEGGKDNLKAVNLPLQSKPWIEWAKLNREEHRRERRGADTVSGYMDKLCMQMRTFRQDQLQLLKQPNIMTDAFIGYLLESVKEKNLYFLKWLKLNLDEISKEILPGLQNKCSLKWNEIRLCEDNEDNEALQEELNEYEEKLAESSFGLEHFMREIAQAYEAVYYTGKEDASDDEMKTQLPRLMAELMLLGYPLELMDGDAGHIPVKWVQAVLEKLSGIIGNKKIFVLSVLGIQSSGKSTLLNTMFGLQFSVAAGRCTRGVYAQLVPVCVEYSNTGYDYILVVDTEGLRAAELGKAKLQHDNEIATLVIGLGDVTLVNVKGENVSEMEDVFQIVIHALLKMCLVNKNLALQPSCIFIHQNVSAPDASQKLRPGQQKFVETLDTVTKAAGKQEDALQYTKFKQLIKFDIETGISYISDLWKGDPPMAPANPGYSKNVNKVKQTLLTEVMQNRSLQLTTEKFSTRLKDLWHGILAQNFVFSFKNSLEMDAYNALEKKLSDILWPLKRTSLEWLNAKKYEIENTDKDLEKVCALLTREFRRHLDKIYNEAQETLEDFFATDDDKALLEQWHTSTFLRLQTSYDDINNRTIGNIKCEIAKKQIKVSQKKDMQTYVSKIMDEAKTVAEGLRLPDSNNLLDEEELNRCFREKWNEWMQMLPQSVNDSINVEDKVNDILEKTYIHERQRLDNARDKKCAKIARNNFLYAIDTYISEGKSLLSYFMKKESTAMKFIDKLLDGIEMQMMPSNEQAVIGESHAKILVDKVSSTVEEMKSSLNFSDVKKFEVSMAIFVSQYVCTKYSRKCSIETVIVYNCELSKYGILPVFEKVLVEKFSFHVIQAMEEIKMLLAQQSRSREFIFDAKEHIQTSKASKNVKKQAGKMINDLFDQVQSYIAGNEIQSFREEYIDEIIRMMRVMINQAESIEFTKTFMIELAVYLCQFTIPVLSEKHKRYTEDMDQRLVYERDNYRPCLERFKNFYFKFTGEQAVANVLSERLNKAIENAVDKDMAKELASDVRSNVSELSCKPAFLKAVLRSLLEEDNFEKFYLYLNDTDASYEMWLTHYVDSYLFSNGPNGCNRYSEIAFRKIESLISYVCEEISKVPSNNLAEKSSEIALKEWIEELCQQLIDKLPLPLEDLLNLAAGYDILSLETFTSYLGKKLLEGKEILKETFQKHKPEHQKQNHEINVYTLIGEECKGCLDKCPFCYAPCYLNNIGHTEAGRKHMALEHHSQACGWCTWEYSDKLIAENCSTLIASEEKFKGEETNWEWYPYKKYRDKFPLWDIHGDPSVEASPYWKWFLNTYAEKLADRYFAEVPDIPASWKGITKEKAFESLGN